MALIIDKEFKELCDPLSPEEYAGLEQSIIDDGCRDGLVIWQNGNGKETLVDGHHRYEICQKHNVKYGTRIKYFKSRQEAINWIIDNQLSRRNVTQERRTYLLGKKYEAEKRDKSQNAAKTKPQNDASNTASKIAKETNNSKATVERAAKYAQAVDKIAETNGNDVKNDILSGKIKTTQSEVKQLADKTPEAQKQVIEQVVSGQAKTVKEAEFRLEYSEPAKKTKSTFNLTNDNIEWAKWTWNPVTGCLHGCEYCYARSINARFSNDGFKPAFHPERLSAPFNTKIPGNIDVSKDPGYKNVFVCSMADLFGEWVDPEWIGEVLDKVEESPQWNFLFLTKNPERLTTYQWPDNAWVGTTVDTQARVQKAVDAFKNINAKVKFLSCEPMLEPLDFHWRLDVFNWMIIGGKSVDGNRPPEQPKWSWVEPLINQARAAKCKIYFKPNLTVRPKEYPAF